MPSTSSVRISRGVTACATLSNVKICVENSTAEGELPAVEHRWRDPSRVPELQKDRDCESSVVGSAAVGFLGNQAARLIRTPVRTELDPDADRIACPTQAVPTW